MCNMDLIMGAPAPTHPAPTDPAPTDPADDGARSATSRLYRLVAKDLLAVNDVIIERMGSHVEMIPDLAGHLVKSGGKRLRPMLTLAAARLFDYEGRDHVRLGAAVEFIHTATLLHDDVVDDSCMRRGVDTANILWGNQASVLVGDFLFSRAFELMVDIGDLEVLKILSRASSIISEGEVMQLDTQKNTDTTIEQYLRVIDAKTAALFAAAARAGGRIAGADATQADHLFAYGRNLGVAFQIADDALDYSGLQADLGKTVGDDFREGKMTMPVVLAISRASVEERAFWERAVAHGEQARGDFDQACEILERRGAISESLEIARTYVDDAVAHVSKLPGNVFRNTLKDLAEFSISRAY